MKNILWLLIINLFLFSCSNNNIDLSPKLQRIELAGDLAKKEFEASSLAWYKNYLIILPQFPHKWDNQFDGAIYFISQKELNNYISGEDKSPIKGEKIHFIADGLDEIGKRDGSGYEAITFINDKVFVSIESIDKDSSSSFIVKGNLDFENRKLVLDKNSKYEIKSQTNIYNMGEEAIFTHKNYIYALHEANGININKSPFSTKLDIELNFVSKIEMPNIDFRITDATSVDSIGKFYALNYYYPGEFKKLKPSLVNKETSIEQIIEFHLENNKIELTNKNPILISNQIEKNGHNWEGIARYNNGFLLITDMFPETILAYYE